MNPIDENTSAREDHRFDLLVDAELSEPQRRRLLAGLEDEPGGWRRCALAFLEAQAWKQDFGSLLPEPASQSTEKQPARRSLRGGYGGTLLAMAASFLVALFLGSLLGGMWHPIGPISRAGPAPRELTEGTPDAQQGTENAEEPPNGPDQPARMVVEDSHPPETPSSPLWMVELAGPEGESAPIRVPAVERDRLDEEWLQSFPTAISPEVLQAWRRAGHQVRQRRQLLPFRLRDGRQLVIPVDEVDIRYVGHPAL